MSDRNRNLHPSTDKNFTNQFEHSSADTQPAIHPRASETQQEHQQEIKEHIPLESHQLLEDDDSSEEGDEEDIDSASDGSTNSDGEVGNKFLNLFGHRQHWSSAEVERFNEGVNKYGWGSWKQIQQRSLGFRQIFSCKTSAVCLL
jgi:hypothetical protein